MTEGRKIRILRQLITHMDKETHVANLIALAKADGVLHAHELIFIQGIALRMGVDGQAFQRIVKYPDIVPQRIPESESDRIRQLGEMLALMHIDFNADKEELAFVERVGVRLGFTNTQVHKLVEFLQSNMLPSDNATLKNIVNS